MEWKVMGGSCRRRILPPPRRFMRGIAGSFLTTKADEEIARRASMLIAWWCGAGGRSRSYFAEVRQLKKTRNSGWTRRAGRADIRGGQHTLGICQT